MAHTSFIGRDIISISDFTKGDMLAVLKVATEYKRVRPEQILKNKVMGACFFEPSTRTRLSFETAMQRLGGGVVGFADPLVTSSKKGETLADTARIVGGYADVLVIRHSLEGAARRAAQATDTPVINAGDGANQHPTQTLLDLFTIQECQKKLTNLTIALVGDLKYGRTVHSLAQAIKHFKPRLFFVAPESLQMPRHICDELKDAQVLFSFHRQLEDVMDKADIVYMTRIQEERFPDKMEYERLKDSFVLRPSACKRAKPNMKILHPLPRVNEIHTAVDTTPHAYYFEQAANGVFVREAVLSLVLGCI